MNLRRYLDVLRTPGVARLAVFTLVGRLPFAIVGLSIVLLMRREGYGYGDIGVVLAAESVAIALTAAPLGRLADRIGRSQVILVLGVATALMLTAETVAMLLKAPVVVLAVAAALQGAAIPPISASMRSLWGTLVPAERVESAYAFDAVQLELVFVVGPLIAAGIATASTPAVGMFLCAGFYLVAGTGFATAPAVRAAVPDVEAERTRAGALGAPGIAIVAGVGLLTAISFGAIEVALPAFTENEGSRAAAGPLITLWALGSALGGLWYGSVVWRAPLDRRLLVLLALLTIGSAPVAFAGSIAVMGPLLVITGLALAPVAITQYALIERLAPAGTSTEAYSWHITATAVGFGIGSAVAGALVEQATVPWALGSAAIACGTGFLLALVARRTLLSAGAEVEA
ncbi:MAG: MFS transporter [Thermoleophilaceae bacterium]